MNSEIKKTPFGNMLEYKRGYTADFVKNAIAKLNLDGLRILDDLDQLESLDFLNDFTFLEKLHIQCMHDHDYSFLKKMPNLISLSIGDSIEMKSTIDLSQQIKLKSLGLAWRKGRIFGLEKCQSITDLTLGTFKEKDLLPISQLVHLKKLKIAVASIISLKGLEYLCELEGILIGYCKSLKSIKDLSNKEYLSKIEIDCCTKIDDFENLVNLPNLVTLELMNCKGVKSISFLKNFPSLKKLVLSESTDILDGNLKPALGLIVVYNHRKHYNVKIENKEQDALALRNLKKLYEISKREGIEDKRILKKIEKLERPQN